MRLAARAVATDQRALLASEVIAIGRAKRLSGES